MADNFGLKIGLEGEREFKAALQEINRSFKVLGSEMNLVASQFEKNDKSVQAITARNQVLNKEIDTQKDKISTLEKALANATESFGENDKRTQAWAIQLNNAKAELNGMERELSSNVKALDAAEKGLSGAGKEAGEFGKSAGDAGKGLDDAGKSTNEFGKEVDSASEKTSIFGDVLKANLAADAIKASLGAIVDLVKEVGAAVKGYLQDSSQLATAASESQTLLTQVMKNTMDASDEEVQSIMDLAKAQEQLGVVSKTSQVTALAELASFVERKEAMEDMLPVMNDYIAYQYGTTASSDQARNVATALGKAIQGNIDGLAKQGFQLTKTEKEWFKTASEAERVAFVIDMVSESMGGVNEALAQTDAGKMAALNTVLDNTKISVGQMANDFKAQILGNMLPSISALSEAFVGVLNGEGSVEDMAASFTGIFDEIDNIINTFIPTFLDLGSQLITGLVTGIADNIDTIVGGVINIVNMFSQTLSELLPTVMDAGIKLLFGLIDGIVAALPMLVEAAAQLIIALADGLGNALPNLIPAVVEAVVTIVNILLGNLDKILDAALKLITGLADGLLAAIPVLIAALPDIISAIVDFLIGAIPQIIEAAVQLLSSLVEAVPVVIKALVDAVPQIINGIIKALLSAVPLIISAGITLLSALVEALPSVIAVVAEAIPEIISGIITAVSDALPLIIEAGMSLFMSLLEAVPEVTIAIVEAVPQIIDGIITALTDTIPLIIEAGIELLSALVEALPEIIAAIVVAVPKIIDGILTAVMAAIPLIIEAGIKLLVSLVEALPEIIGAIVDAIPEIIDGIITAVIASIPEIIETGVKLLVSLIENLPQIIVTVAAAIPQIVGGLVNAIIGNIDKIINAGVQLFVALIQNLPTIIVEIVKAVPLIMDALVSAFAGMMSRMWDVGTDIVKGIWEGIKNAAGWIKDKLTGFFKDMLGGIASFLGISSPSKVFEEMVGKNIALGVAQGIEKNSDKASKAAAKMAKDAYSNATLWIKDYQNSTDYLISEEIKMWETLGSRYDSLSKEKVEIDRNVARLQDKVLKEREAAEKKLAKEREETDKKSYEHSKDWIDKRKRTGELSMLAEVQAWERVQSRYAEGTELRKKADKELFDAQKRLSDEQERITSKMEAAEDKYAAAFEKRADAIYKSFGLFEQLKEKEEVSSKTLSENLSSQVDELRHWSENLEKLSKKGVDEGLVAELRAMGPKANAEISALNSMTDIELTKYQELWQKKNELARTMALEELTGLREDTDEEIKGFAADLAKLSIAEPLAEGISDGLPEITNVMPEVVNAAVVAVQGEAPVIILQGEEIDKQLGEGMVSGINQITQNIPQIVRNIADKFQSHTPIYINIGQNIMTGIGEGIISMSGWLNNLLRNYIDSMVAAIEARLQISSPSQVFAGIGGFMAEGIGEGFTRAMNNVRSDIISAIPVPDIPAPNFGAGYEMRGALAGAYGGAGHNITNHLNFYTPTATPSEIARASQKASEQMLRYVK